MVKITLSGTTVNESLRFIYQSSKGFSYKTGTGEIFLLRDLLKKYGKQANLKDKSVYLYALTGGLKSQSINPKWWKVYPQDLQIRRSKDNPLSYNYTLTLLGEPEGEETTSWLSTTLSTVSSIMKWFYLAVQVTETVMSLMEQACSSINTIKKIYEKITSYKSTLEFYLTDYIDFRNGNFESSSSVTEDTTSLGDTQLATATRYNYTLKDALYSACKDILSACKELHEALQEDITFPQDVLEYFDSDSDEILDILNLQALKLEDSWLEFYNEYCELIRVNDVTVIPGGTDEDDKLVEVYGYINYTAKDTDTWDSLALKYYNDANYAPMLQCYNKISDEIEAGTQITIPILSQTSSTTSNNALCNAPDVKDNYGVDCALDADGNLKVHLTDLQTVSGKSTLTQAIKNRLSTVINSRIRLEVYGIRNIVGDANQAAQSFIVASIQQTLLADPRVKEVSDITYTGNGESLTVSVTYVDINDSTQTFGGTL